MRKQFWYFFVVGWVVMLIGACQSDTINPAKVVPGNSIEDLMSQPFSLDMDINQVLLYKELVEVTGEGVSTLNNDFKVRSQFNFNLKTCASKGFLKVEFEEPGYVYAFEIYGTGHLEETIWTSDEVAIPLKLIYSTEPKNVEFEGYMYLQNPECLAEEQKGTVSRTAYISRTEPVELIGGT